MSLRDFNEPTEPMALHTDPAGNSGGLDAFHTVNPEVREPNNTPKIVGALAVALMVGVAGVGLYAYSGSSPKPVVADNSLPQQNAAPIAPPPAAAPAPAAQQAANTPADAAPVAAPDNSAPAPAPVKEASVKPIRHHASDSASVDNSQTASNDAASVRMNADSSAQTTQAPAQQATVQAPAQQAAATPLPPAPQPSPSDVASNNTQPNQGVQSAAPAPDATAAQNTAQPAPQAPAPQPAAPVEQTGTAPAPAQ